MSAISDAAHSASTKKGGGGRDHSGGTVTNHFKLMQDAMLELLCKIKFLKKRPDSSWHEYWNLKVNQS